MPNVGRANSILPMPRMCSGCWIPAYQGISDGLFAGMVTAPLHKGIINDAHAGNGFFSGHTEYLAEKAIPNKSS